MKLCLLILFSCFYLPLAGFSQPVFTITIRVEDATVYTAYRNEPLVFSTSLHNRQYQNNLEWNQEADTYLAELEADYKAGNLSKEEYEKETEIVRSGKRQLQLYSIGTRQSPWFQQLQFRILFNGVEQNWPIGILGDPPKDSVAILDENGNYFIQHHLGPEQMITRKPGTYTIQVLLAGVWSNPVSVKIKSDLMPLRVFLSETVQLRLGNYYLDRKQPVLALVFASSVLKRDKKNVNALALRGEIYIERKKYKQALADFEKALELYNKKPPLSFEPPKYLLFMIAWLKEKLQQK